MSITSVAFGVIMLVRTPCAVELSVWIGVRGCGWPISLRVVLTGTANFALMNIAPSLASATDDIATFQDCSIISWDIVVACHEEMSPALLRAFGWERYDASLWMANIMSDAL